jgi:hypothetical protein
MKKQIQAPAETKQEWVRPELQRIEAGSAESRDGTRADGGAGFQGS